jgi:hypothetical protein
MFSLLVLPLQRTKKTAPRTVTVFNAVLLISIFAVLFYIYNDKYAQNKKARGHLVKRMIIGDI